MRVSFTYFNSVHPHKLTLYYNIGIHYCGEINIEKKNRNTIYFILFFLDLIDFRLDFLYPFLC